MTRQKFFASETCWEAEKVKALPHGGRKNTQLVQIGAFERHWRSDFQKNV